MFKPYINDLTDIEAAIKSTCDHVATGPGWFEQHWKPKFDRVRSLMVPPHYAKVVAEIQEIECYARDN